MGSANASKQPFDKAKKQEKTTTFTWFFIFFTNSQMPYASVFQYFICFGWKPRTFIIISHSPRKRQIYSSRKIASGVHEPKKMFTKQKQKNKEFIKEMNEKYKETEHKEKKTTNKDHYKKDYMMPYIYNHNEE